jgi:hypothetical protein
MASHSGLAPGNLRLAAARPRPGRPPGRPPDRRARSAGYGLPAGYAVMAATTAAAVALGGTRHPGVALALLAAATFAVAMRTTAAAALGTCVIGWLFYSGFITGRHADLAWHGPADLLQLAVLAGAALCGMALSWWSARRASGRRPTRPVGPADLPAQDPVIIDLASARGSHGR